MFGRWQAFARDEHGRVTAFVVLITTACLLFAGLVLDGGLALAAKTKAIGHAQEAARAGAQELDLAAYRASGDARLHPSAAQAAARRYLSAVGATGTVTADATTVRVHIDAQQRTHILGLIGLGEIAVSADGQAHPDQGTFGGAG
ncbi:pilus assembly protein TadG-related protein [Saccharopolyspora sp. K220]|uniref:pilus assembly protein TadG-related protein n=1 Tax=Saccharopolyspora soli TaxID=2926618 RepID=UPI001F5824FF|nr:pilus assembly protein TadG-related protein [Saccharopolyspora soli]MCI2420080.1 pilus assembly protein TadG-related protein [Saccharopolyspora soli]